MRRDNGLGPPGSLVVERHYIPMPADLVNDVGLTDRALRLYAVLAVAQADARGDAVHRLVRHHGWCPTDVDAAALELLERGAITAEARRLASAVCGAHEHAGGITATRS